MADIQYKAYLIPGLVNDVALEIFLHFVAIDPDGPFTLVLVCNNWRDLVLSNSRLWTWITVDESQPDWRDRIHISVALSRNLPMQLILRIPFNDVERILDALPRCTVAFIETPKWNKAIPQGSTLITHEEFAERRDQYEELHNLVVITLSSVVKRGLVAFIESTDDTCLSYATWTIFERVFKAKTMEDQLQDIPIHLITTLIFEDKPKRMPRRVRILNIWPHLPSLPYLRLLEISDNFVGGDNPSTVPTIALPSLRNLSIDCVTGWRFRAQGLAFDLFSLLDRLDAPAIHDVILYGSVNQLIDTVGKVNNGVRPSNLNLSFLSAENSGLQTLHQAPILRQLHRLTMDFFDPQWSSVKWTTSMRLRLIPKLQSLIPFVPEGCSINFHGGDELYHILNLDISAMVALNVTYRSGTLRIQPRRSPAPLLQSFTLQAGSPNSPTYIPWFQSAQRILLEAADLDILLPRTISGPSIVEVLDTDISTMESHKGAHMCSITPKYSGRFPHLTRMRGTTEVVQAFILHFDMRNLQEITLCINESGSIGPFDSFVSALFNRQHFLTRLEILGIEAFPSWPPLLRLVSAFKALGGEGITTVKLPGFPHPSMLQPLLDALGHNSGDYVPRLPYDDQEGRNDSGELGCSACKGSGWTCYEGIQCDRFSPDTMVYITKETYIGKYVLR